MALWGEQVRNLRLRIRLTTELSGASRFCFSIDI